MGSSVATQAQNYLNSLPSSLLFFKVVLPITRAETSLEGEMWLHIEASGPERDTHGSRMSEEALGKMVSYIERGWNGERLPYLDGHYRDLLAAELGTIHDPTLTEENHLSVKAYLDPENPQSLRLWKSILKGRKHGASIAGFVHSFRIEALEDGTEDWIIDDIELIEISRTSYPSWQASFTTMLVNNASPLSLSAPMALPFIERRFAAFGDTPGFLSCTRADDGAWLCKRATSPQTLDGGGTMKTQVVGNVDPTLDPYADAEEPQEFGEITSTPAEEARSDGEPVAEVQTTEPVEMAVVTEERSDESDETPCAQAVAGEQPCEERSEISGEPVADAEPVVRSSLQAKVEASMLVRKFAEYVWTMMDMVFDALVDSEQEPAGRAQMATEVLGDFVDVVVPLVTQLANDGAMRRSDMVAAIHERVELSDAQFSRARIGALQGAMDGMMMHFASLVNLMESADVVDVVTPSVEKVLQVESDEPEPVQRTNALKQAVEDAMVGLKSDLLAKMASLEGAQSKLLADTLSAVEELTTTPVEPRGNVAKVEAPSPGDRRSASKKAFLSSIG